MVFEILTAVLSIFYSILVGWFSHGWRKLRASTIQDADGSNDSESVALMIPFRNEQKHLLLLAKAITQLEPSSFRLEVIWVNDHSEDHSVLLLTPFLEKEPNWKLLNLPQNQYGKKAALSFGILNTTAKWILCTDADCIPHPNWVNRMMSTAVGSQASLVSGPVKLMGNDWFGSLQAIEFMSLNAIGGACLALDNPVIANGANLLYNRSSWLKVGGFSQHQQIPSGDDDLLLHQFALKGFKTAFCYHREAVIATQPCETFVAFVNQRLRWISKSGRYDRKDITLILVMVWLYMAGVVGLFLTGNWLLASVLWAIKWVADAVFLWNPSHFYGLRKEWLLLPIVQIFYLPYVLIAGLAGNFGPYQWKGRTHQSMRI